MVVKCRPLPAVTFVAKSGWAAGVSCSMHKHKHLGIQGRVGLGLGAGFELTSRSFLPSFLLGHENKAFYHMYVCVKPPAVVCQANRNLDYIRIDL